MTAVLSMLVAWPARHGPAPAGSAGLVLALVTVLVLVSYQLRPPWVSRRPPGPVRRRPPLAVTESRHLYWASTGTLVLVVAFVVVERFVVMT